MAEKIYENVTVTPKEHSEVEIRGEIPVSAALLYRSRALKSIGANATIPGFRKGHIPDNVLIRKFGEQAILEEVAEMALGDAYPAIVLEHGLKVIGHPAITITKIAQGNPIGFTVTTAIMPEVILPDYTAIGREIAKKPYEESEPTTQEIENAILQIRKNKWHIDHQKKAGDTPSGATQKKPEEKDLPEISDELVKTLGDFKDVNDFKEKLANGIRKEKQERAKGARRAEIGEKLIAQTKADLPRILVESELEKMAAQFKHDIAAMGMPFDEYLKKINKTEETLRTEWKTDAEKRAKLQLTLNNIAKKENIVPSEEEVKQQTDHILAHHKDANPDNVRIYVTTTLTNEKVFQLLEKPAD